MEPISIILFALPNLVREFLRSATGRHPEARLVAELEPGDDLLDAVGRTTGRIAVVGNGLLTDEQIAAVLRARCDARVLELVDDGRETLLYELRPHRVRLGQVSLDALVGWILAPPPSTYVSEAS